MARQFKRFYRRGGALIVSIFCAGHIAAATDKGFDPTFKFFGQADLRLATANGARSSFGGGFGKFRFGENQDTTASSDLRLTEVSLTLRSQLTSSLSAQITGQYNPDGGQEIDLVEAFLRWRPVSLSRTRFSLKAGAVFPKVSFENTGRAWSNIYTLTNSAANTWIAEEFRPVGIEGTLQYRAEDYDLSWTAGAFFANDRSGVALAFRGFTLNAQKLGLWGTLPISDLPPGRVGASNQPFIEADDRPGFSLGLHWKHRALGEISIYAADNRADTAVVSDSGRLWRTRFINVAAERKFGMGWTLGAQLMYGDTITNPGGVEALVIGTRFFSISGLGARDIGKKIRLAVRAEYFDQQDISTVPPAPDLNEKGYALTAAGTFKVSKNIAMTAEWVHSNAERFETGVSTPIDLTENLLQLNLRASF